MHSRKQESNVLQWNVAVLFPWSVLLLVCQHIKLFAKTLTGRTGLNDVVYKPAARSCQRVCKEVLILCNVLGSVTTASKNDLNSTFGAHDRNFT